MASHRTASRNNKSEGMSTFERIHFKCGVFFILVLTALIALAREKSLINKVFAARTEIPTETPVKEIKQISILGERNSGTRWTFAHLKSCFNNSLPVRRRLTRYKHWFQHSDTSEYPSDTLVVAQFRNPYDWIEAMHQVPHHCPAHIDLDWKEFCTKEWTTERVGADLNITDYENPICQQKFHYKDIVSCLRKPLPDEAYDHKLRFSENQPFYEMRNDGSGLPYRNIMEMRADKIRNFVQVKEYEGVRDVWVTQYEYLLAKGTKELLDRISRLTGVEYQCNPYKGQNRRRRPITKDYVDFLSQHLDWEAESLAGYSKFTEGGDSGLNVIDLDKTTE